MCGYMFVHIQVKARYQPSVSFIRELTTVFLRQGLSLALNSKSSLGQLATKTQGSTCLYLHSTGITGGRLTKYPT